LQIVDAEIQVAEFVEEAELWRYTTVEAIV
jgi:hypothetical protein